MEAENGKERKPILMVAVTTQSFTNNSREQPQLALDCNTPESNDSSLITTNNIGAAHNQGFPTDQDDESNNFNINSKIKEQGFFSKPPEYRFLPIDKELIIFYLEKKVWNQPLPINKIVEVNLYAYNPNFLAAKYKDYQEDQLYIFTPRDRKYRNGRRPNRAAGDGYWKATEADRKIKSNGTIVGIGRPWFFIWERLQRQPESAAQCNNDHALDSGATFNGYFNYASPPDLPATMVPPIGWSKWVYNSTDQTVFGSNYPNEPSEFQEDLWMSLPSQLDPRSYSYYQESYVHLPDSVPNNNPDSVLNNNPNDSDGSEESDD
ncbi:NAC transcription factor 25-like [Juglans microcarpa x Juglans regia]|uniref:NAC transcription factor 25-like n=1 Tax=Juglans microcarpa x Juglans regia TaxID=2249226 RepID=UPI001B7EDCAF|nr:NAC transcription factor 25-like [Juglans microcarpa x Juglans regia]